MPKLRSMTLAEIRNIRATDEAYVRMRAERDAEFARRDEVMRQDSSPLLRDINDQGYDIASVWDLVNTPDPYPELIPILIRHLRSPYLDRNREAIARSLAVAEAAYAWQLLKQEYIEATADSGYKHGLGTALSANLSDDIVDQVKSLIIDRRHGTSRMFLIYRLLKMKTSVSKRAIAELQLDPDIKLEIDNVRKSR